MKKLTRRDFLKGTAASALAISAMGIMGCASDAQTSTADTTTQNGTTAANDEVVDSGIVLEEGQYAFEIPPTVVDEADIEETIDVEMCVIGAGQAGTTAALTAAYLGASCVVLQKAPSVHTHGRIVCCTGANFQTAQPDKAAITAEWTTANGGLADGRLIKLFVDYSGECFDWFNQVAEENNLEHRWVPAADPSQTWGSQSGLTVWSDGSFYHRNFTFCQAVTPIAQAKGVDYRFGCPAQYLEKDNTGRVTGVIALNEETGKYIRVNASKAVLMCTGDIGNNEDMLKKYATLSVGVPSAYVGAYNTGDGQRMLMWAGAQMQKAPYCSGIHLDPTTLPEGNAPHSDYSWLAVNCDGERFMNEEMWYQAKVAAALIQRDIVFYQIGGPDMKTYCENTVDARKYTWEEGVAGGAIVEAATIEELADLIGLPAETLAETVAKYNAYYENGEDTEFGKSMAAFENTLLPAEGPFYAIKRSPGSLCVFGGACCTPRLQVIDNAGQPIEGLYVAGNTIGRMYGYEYPESMGGTLSGRAFALGRMAARFALGDL